MRSETINSAIERIAALARQYAQSCDPSDEELQDKVESLVDEETGTLDLSIREIMDITDRVYSSIRGLGPLDQLLKDENVTEIMVNGPDKVFVERGGGLTLEPIAFKDEEELENIIQAIVSKVGRVVNTSNPIADARLTDGSRVNVVLPPIALCGAVITIRKFSKEPMTMDRLIRYGSVTPQIASILRELVESRYNIFVSGGTGSGKTTFLNALSNFIPADERVITIEDSAELQIVNIPNLVSLETRSSNGAKTEGVEITIRDLIKSALRMRPDRIVVGEVRGAEALDMLQAMNTGHDGSLSTGHANTAEDMLSRLETMVITGAANMPLPAIRQQISSAVDIIIHLSRMRDKSRKTVSISEVDGMDELGNVRLNTLFEFVEDVDASSNNKVVGKLLRTSNPFKHTRKLVAAGKDAGLLDPERFEYRE